jgi:hypothetical protein
MRRHALATVLGLGAVAAVEACASDAVLPDQQATATCGNGVVEPGEACDNASPGCAQCLVVPTWTCPANVCSPICGDGVLGSGPTCAGAHRDSDCDLTGFWAVRETNYACDGIFHNPQTTSQWYLFEIAQRGDGFEVISDFDCGAHVSGSVTVDYTLPSLHGVMYLNAMDGRSPHGRRTGTSSRVAGGCAASLERWYMIEGVTTDYLPTDFSAKPSLDSLRPMPSVKDPTSAVVDLPGTTDPDGDGFPGIAIRIAGIVSGIRDSAQRDWKEFASIPGSPVDAAALTFHFPGAFGLQENVLHVSECGTGCGLLNSPAPASMAPGRVTFALLGKTLGSARVSSVVVAPPLESIDSDLATCANLRLLLPHDPTSPPGACPKSGL